jgi:hypothetical protein
MRQHGNVRRAEETGVEAVGKKCSRKEERI